MPLLLFSQLLWHHAPLFLQVALPSTKCGCSPVWVCMWQDADLILIGRVGASTVSKPLQLVMQDVIAGHPPDPLDIISLAAALRMPTQCHDTIQLQAHGLSAGGGAHERQEAGVEHHEESLL